MESTEPTSNGFAESRLVPSRWIEPGAKAVRSLFGDARTDGDLPRGESRQDRDRTRATSATNSESARKLRFWFGERNRHTL